MLGALGVVAGAAIAGALVPAPWSYVVQGLVLALPASLALGRRWVRQLALAFACVVFFGALYVAALAVGCPEDARECAPELVLLLGGFVLIGWLLGIGGAALVLRMRRPVR